MFPRVLADLSSEALLLLLPLLLLLLLPPVSVLGDAVAAELELEEPLPRIPSYCHPPPAPEAYLGPVVAALFSKRCLLAVPMMLGPLPPPLLLSLLLVRLLLNLGSGR